MVLRSRILRSPQKGAPSWTWAAATLFTLCTAYPGAFGCRAVDPQDRLPAAREQSTKKDPGLLPERIAAELIDYERCIFALRESIETPRQGQGPDFSEKGERWSLGMQHNAIGQCESDLHSQLQGHRPQLNELEDLFKSAKSTLQSARDLQRMHELLLQESDPQLADPARSAEQSKVILTAQRIRTRSATQQLRQDIAATEAIIDKIHARNDQGLLRIMNGRDPVWRTSGRALAFALRDLRRCIEAISDSPRPKDKRPCAGSQTRVDRLSQQLLALLSKMKRSPLLGLSALAQCSRDCSEAAALISPTPAMKHNVEQRQRSARQSCSICEMTGLRIPWDAM